MKTVVFIGSGRITSALLAGLHLAKFRSRIVVHGRNPESLRHLKKLYGVEIEKSLERAVQRAGLLIIAVRPASVAALLKDISPVKRPLVAVSLAAGIPFSKLRPALKGRVNWVRAMPSPVCRSGKGLTALAFDRGVRGSVREEVTALFSKVGFTLEVPEPKFDAFTVTYSCSHGYHALAALSAAAQQIGLDRKTALQAAAHALADGIVAWREGNIPLDDLLEEAVTPGGIAAAVTGAMDRSGYQRAVKVGLQSGLKKARKNSKLA